MDRVPVAPQIVLAVPAAGKMPLESGSLLGFEPAFEVFGKKFDQFATGHRLARMRALLPSVSESRMPPDSHGYESEFLLAGPD